MSELLDIHIATDPMQEDEGALLRRRVPRALRHASVVAATIWVLLAVVVALLAPQLAPYDPNSQVLLDAFQDPSGTHWLGTDDLGRDLLSRLIWGARVSMQVGVVVTMLVIAIAVPVGLLAGYLGGRSDFMLMRLVDAGLSFPPLVLALAVAATLGRSVTNVIIALTVVFTPQMIRLVRGQVLVVRQEVYIEASQTLSTPLWRVLLRRVLPNVAPAILVAASFAMSGAMLAEAGLSFLGVGVQPPTSSWGGMLRRAYDSALFRHQWELVVPAVAIALTVLSFNVIGDGLQDAMGKERLPVPRKHRLGLTSVTGAMSRPPDPQQSALLQVRDLRVSAKSGSEEHEIVSGVDIDIHDGEIVGLVGESGSGKSMTALSIMRLAPSPAVSITGGSISYDGTDLLAADFATMRRIRGAGISMVFQDPMTSLNPAFTIGNQLVEAIRLHTKIGQKEATRHAGELLDRVGIAGASERLGDYPHELSGGMRQRVMIASAIACRPRLLIADEATTALDVTIQAQVLDLLRELQADYKMAMLLITHDLGVVADICDRAMVMYAGQIVEEAPVDDLFDSPRHPYTEGLLAAMPSAGPRTGRLAVIPGRVPPLAARPIGCTFHPRCSYATAACTEGPVELVDVGDRHVTRCVRTSEIVLEGKS